MDKNDVSWPRRRGNGASLPARLTSPHLPSPVTLDGSLRVECDVKFAVADTAEREICSAVSQWRVFLSTGFFLPPQRSFFEVKAQGLYGASVRLTSLLAGYCSESF